MKVRPGDLVKHADWEKSPLNSYRDEVGFVVAYDQKRWHDVEKTQKQWVVVQWLPRRENQPTVIYHVDSLKRHDEC